MLLDRYRYEELPDFDGIVDRSNQLYFFRDSELIEYTGEEPNGTLFIVTLASRELYGGSFRVKCGEATNHGSIGWIVLEDSVSGEAQWAFASQDVDPFDQIEIKGGFVILLSTGGTVFRFRPPFHNVSLHTPK